MIIPGGARAGRASMVHPGEACPARFTITAPGRARQEAAPMSP